MSGETKEETNKGADPSSAQHPILVEQPSDKTKEKAGAAEIHQQSCEGASTSRLNLIAITLISLFMFAAIMWILLRPISAPMMANVITESWSIDVTSKLPSYLNRRPVTFFGSSKDCQDLDGDHSRGHLEFPEILPYPMTVTFVAHDQSRFTVSFEPAQKGNIADRRPYAVAFCAAGSVEIVEPAVFVFSMEQDEEHVTFASGRVVVGRIPNNASEDRPRMLLQGSVVTVTNSWPFSSTRVEARSPLSLGDEVQFWADEDLRVPASSHVVSRFWPDKSAFELVVLSAEAKQATVGQFGRLESYRILNSPPLIERLKASPELAVVIAAWAFLASVFSGYRNVLLQKVLGRLGSG